MELEGYKSAGREPIIHLNLILLTVVGGRGEGPAVVHTKFKTWQYASLPLFHQSIFTILALTQFPSLPIGKRDSHMAAIYVELAMDTRHNKS